MVFARRVVAPPFLPIGPRHSPVIENLTALDDDIANVDPDAELDHMSA
jgi:hypothetical protein